LSSYAARSLGATVWPSPCASTERNWPKTGTVSGGVACAAAVAGRRAAANAAARAAVAPLPLRTRANVSETAVTGRRWWRLRLPLRVSSRPGMGRTRATRVALVLLAGLAALGMTIAAPGSGRSARRRAPRRGPHVLLVGTWHHIRGHYRSIQAAVDAAKPGDWILVAPGDYHEQADRSASRGPQPAKTPAGIV